MPRRIPMTLERLLSASSDVRRADAWAAFVREFSRVIHLAARKGARGYDDTMDRYTFILDRLRADDFARLRKFEGDGRSRFTTWLVVVASRLGVDFHRSRYGRFTNPDDHALRDTRRRLVDLVGEAIDMSEVLDSGRPGPARDAELAERTQILSAAIDELPETDGLLLRLRFQEELSMAEAARLSGLSSQFGGYRRIKVILARLRSDLEARGLGREDL